LSKKRAFYESLNYSAVLVFSNLNNTAISQKAKKFCATIYTMPRKGGEGKMAGHIAYAILTSGKESLRFI